MVFELFKQLFKRPATNKFPAKYTPANVTAVVEKALRGEITLHPPIPVPPQYRGKLVYDKEKCNGCGLCTRVCAAAAVVLVGEKKAKKIVHYVARCTFCAQCVDACPQGALRTSEEFALADTNKFSDRLVVK
jgi:formate hydrogenlyase subunit 6/NADH:ubiquinone oxidoreductase subunit I